MSCESTPNAVLITSPQSNIIKNIISVWDLPHYTCNIYVLSSFDWFGQFGHIICINIDEHTNCANIQFSTEEEATSAKNWANSLSITGKYLRYKLGADYASSNPHQLINKCTKPSKPEISESQCKTPNECTCKHCTDLKQSAERIITSSHKLEEIEFRQDEFQHREEAFKIRECEFEKQVKQFQGQIQQFLLKKQEMEHTILTVTGTNNELISEIETFKHRIQKLDSKYTIIFKQLVKRILDTERMSSDTTEELLVFSDTLHRKKTKAIRRAIYERLKCELSEKYDDLCVINEYVTELETRLNLEIELECNYKAWDIYDVYRWLIKIKNGRFNTKDNKHLMVQLRKYAIYGLRLEHLSDADLSELRIYNSPERKLLLSEIELLIQKQNKSIQDHKKEIDSYWN